MNISFYKKLCILFIPFNKVFKSSSLYNGVGNIKFKEINNIKQTVIFLFVTDTFYIKFKIYLYLLTE